MGDGDRLIDTTKLMKEWITLGDAHEDDPFIAFMAYWVAFNMLYQLDMERYYEVHKRECTERAGVQLCFKANRRTFNRYDPYRCGEADIFMDDAAKRLYKREGEADEELAKVRNKERDALLYAVYRVRCNFFHGNKKLGDGTDRKFVTAGAIIIRKYLETLGYFSDMNPALLGRWRAEAAVDS